MLKLAFEMIQIIHKLFYTCRKRNGSSSLVGRVHVLLLVWLLVTISVQPPVQQYYLP